jgi:hypothetical protein
VCVSTRTSVLLQLQHSVPAKINYCKSSLFALTSLEDSDFFSRLFLGKHKHDDNMTNTKQLVYPLTGLFLPSYYKKSRNIQVYNVINMSGQ